MGKRDANDIVQAPAPVSNADHVRRDGRLLIGKRRRRHNAHPSCSNASTNTDALAHPNAYTHPDANADADPHANTLPHHQL